MNKDTKFYVEGLRSNECACGEMKKQGMSFCFPCYQTLPKSMQRNLWSIIGHGYEEAYEVAHKELVERGRIE